MIELEKFTAEDYPLFSRLVFNEQAMKMNLGRVFTAAEAEQFFQMILADNAEETALGYYKVYGRLDGEKEYIGMGAASWNGGDAVEIEYMLLPRAWHRGCGTALAGRLIRLAGEARPGADVTAITDPANVYSRKILLRAGFTLEKEYVNEDGEPAELYRRKCETGDAAPFA